MGRLENLVAVVTGGGRGIGRAIALELAREGASVVISSRTRDQLNSVVDEIESIGSSALAVEMPEYPMPKIPTLQLGKLLGPDPRGDSDWQDAGRRSEGDRGGDRDPVPK